MTPQPERKRFGSLWQTRCVCGRWKAERSPRCQRCNSAIRIRRANGTYTSQTVLS